MKVIVVDHEGNAQERDTFAVVWDNPGKESYGMATSCGPELLANGISTLLKTLRKDCDDDNEFRHLFVQIVASVYPQETAAALMLGRLKSKKEGAVQ